LGDNKFSEFIEDCRDKNKERENQKVPTLSIGELLLRKLDERDFGEGEYMDADDFITLSNV
jgi:hypothetical protein